MIDDYYTLAECDLGCDRVALLKTLDVTAVCYACRRAYLMTRMDAPLVYVQLVVRRPVSPMR